MTFGPDNTPFDSMGGEARVRLLVDAFYDQMEAAAEFSTIRVMHPDNLDESRQKLFEFLCGWLGDPRSIWNDVVIQSFEFGMHRSPSGSANETSGCRAWGMRWISWRSMVSCVNSSRAVSHRSQISCGINLARIQNPDTSDLG